MKNDVWTYSRLLAEQLRSNGMREPQVREVVAQVQQHVRETGDDPVVAFGQPSAYAREWKQLTPRAWAVRLLGAGAAVTSLQAGVVAAFAGVGWGDEVPVDGGVVFTWVVWMIGLAIAPWTVSLWLSRRLAGGLGHRLWGHQTLVRLAFVFLLIGLAVGVGMAFSLPSDSTVVSLPRWVLLVTFLVGLPGWVYFGGPARQMPKAPGTESWMKRLRRAMFTP